MDPKAQKIAETALSLFFRHGYSKTTMLDIAEEVGISRPTLYSSFENKEAVFAALLLHSADQYEAEALRKLARRKKLQDRLEAFFDVWVIRPFASVIDSPNGADLLNNCDTYAPEATDAMYLRLETQLASVLKPAMSRKRALSADDLAHILTTAIRGLKSTTQTLPELKRMVNGLVSMAVATVGGKA